MKQYNVRVVSESMVCILRFYALNEAAVIEAVKIIYGSTESITAIQILGVFE